MPLPTATDCWPVVADRCRWPLAGALAGRRTSGSPGCKDNGFFGAHQLFASKSFSGPKGHHRRRNRCRRGAPSPEGIAAEGSAARKPHRNAALTLPRRHCRPKGASPPKGPPPQRGTVARRRCRRRNRRPEARRTAVLPLPRRHCRPEARRRRHRRPEAPQKRRAPAAAEASRPEGHHRRRNRPLSGIASGGASHFCSRPSKLPARRSCPLSRQPVEAARYRSSPSNRWLKSSCGAGM